MKSDTSQNMLNTKSTAHFVAVLKLTFNRIGLKSSSDARARVQPLGLARCNPCSLNGRMQTRMHYLSANVQSKKNNEKRKHVTMLCWNYGVENELMECV